MSFGLSVPSTRICLLGFLSGGLRVSEATWTGRVTSTIPAIHQLRQCSVRSGILGSTLEPAGRVLPQEGCLEFGRAGGAGGCPNRIALVAADLVAHFEKRVVEAMDGKEIVSMLGAGMPKLTTREWQAIPSMPRPRCPVGWRALGDAPCVRPKSESIARAGPLEVERSSRRSNRRRLLKSRG